MLRSLQRLGSEEAILAFRGNTYKHLIHGALSHEKTGCQCPHFWEMNHQWRTVGPFQDA